MGWLQVVPGQVVGSEHMNTAIRQGVVPFANAAARAAAIPAPVKGQLSWLDDPGVYESWTGTAWVGLNSGAHINGTHPVTSVPQNTVVTLPLTVVGSAGFTVTGGNAAVVPRLGYYACYSHVKFNAAIPSAVRAFVAIQHSSGTLLGRASFGPNEDAVSVAVVMNLAAATSLSVQVFQGTTGAMNITLGQFAFRYLGKD